LNGDGYLDLAVLNENSQDVAIYLGDGNGSFTLLANRPHVGPGCSGLLLRDGTGTGRAPAGKVDPVGRSNMGHGLLPVGNGDGTFRPFVRADQSVPFVTTDLNGDGVADVVLANQGADLASAQLRKPGTNSFTPGTFQANGTNGLVGPGAVALGDLDGK